MIVTWIRGSKVRVHRVVWLQRRVQSRDHASLALFALWTETKCQRYLREYLLQYVCLYGLKFARHRVFKLTEGNRKTISPFHPRNAAKTIVGLCTKPRKLKAGGTVNVFVIRRPFLSTRSWTGLALEMRRQETFSVSFLIYYLPEGIGSFSNSVVFTTSCQIYFALLCLVLENDYVYCWMLKVKTW